MGHQTYNILSHVFHDHPQVQYGIADISESSFAKEYNRALMYCVPHGEQLTLSTYQEAQLEQLIHDAREIIDSIQTELTVRFQNTSIPFYFPPVAQDSEETLIAPFSFKFGATKAGLGWIGKNGLLVTEQYGPRVRLGAMLLRDDILPAQPILQSRCPVECTACLKACPYDLLKGCLWDCETKRTELIDYHRCNEKRSMFIPKHGRKHACGYCMVACPLGLES